MERTSYATALWKSLESIIFQFFIFENKKKNKKLNVEGEQNRFFSFFYEGVLKLYFNVKVVTISFSRVANFGN